MLRNSLPLHTELLPTMVWCSGKVLKAQFNGEVVAVKEIKLDQSDEVQEAFVAVSGDGREWAWDWGG